ncbi:hypothetical protein [Flavobacterium sp. J27]|uniref:hypothetical protein n=1 Tax=Flavobacterium sp. J27 TaxID=2060419 RepID=UPI001031FCC5|nr:hypothetical protein [Flavobacterium sp. J27]
MKTSAIYNKVIIDSFCLMVATCTNDLVVQAKQVNYFEMFLLSFVIECKSYWFHQHTFSLGIFLQNIKQTFISLKNSKNVEFHYHFKLQNELLFEKINYSYFSNAVSTLGFLNSNRKK